MLLFHVHIIFLGDPGEVLHVLFVQIFVVDALVSGVHPPHAGAAAHAEGKELAGAALGIPGGIVHDVADFVHLAGNLALDVAVAQVVHADVRPALVELAVRVDDQAVHGVGAADVVPDDRVFVHDHIRVVDVHQVIILVFQEALLGEALPDAVGAVVVVDGGGIGNIVLQVMFLDDPDDLVHRVGIVLIRIDPEGNRGNDPVRIDDVFDNGIVGTLAGVVGPALVMVFPVPVYRDLAFPDPLVHQQFRGGTIQQVAVGHDGGGVFDPVLVTDLNKGIRQSFDDIQGQQRFPAVPGHMQLVDLLRRVPDVFDDRLLDAVVHDDIPVDLILIAVHTAEIAAGGGGNRQAQGAGVVPALIHPVPDNGQLVTVLLDQEAVFDQLIHHGGGFFPGIRSERAQVFLVVFLRQQDKGAVETVVGDVFLPFRVKEIVVGCLQHRISLQSLFI